MIAGWQKQVIKESKVKIQQRRKKFSETPIKMKESLFQRSKKKMKKEGLIPQRQVRHQQNYRSSKPPPEALKKARGRPRKYPIGSTWSQRKQIREGQNEELAIKMVRSGSGWMVTNTKR